MADGLRPFLLLLVLLNLALVQSTGAVDTGWMLALWGTAIAAPILTRLSEILVYRLVWNAAVLIAFAFLVHHALTTGLLHMLEDGMLLAALCQVHLLNNVGRRQRPDLLFFNSFLITFVTSFFSHDLVWSVCFFAYAAVLIPALQLHVVLPRQARCDPGLLRAVLRDGAPRALVALLLTALAFVLWPRNFRHEGWLSDTLAFADPKLIAFADEIRLDRTSTPALSDSPVMRIRSRRDALAPPEHWRGVTFVHFDGSGWDQYRIFDFGSRRATDVPWQAVSSLEWRRPGEQGPRDEFDVRLLDPSAGRLFLPLEAISVALRSGEGVLIDPKADGILALEPTTQTRGELRFTVARAEVPPRHRPIVGQAALARLRQLPVNLPRPLLLLAEQLRRELPKQATEAQIAEHFRNWLSSHRRYALPGTSGAARNLGEFLLGTGGGHCEYFATTLALLLRLQDLPCRVVGGYLAHEWDNAAREVVVRQRDAHAWVEVLLPTDGWTTLDATPVGDLRRSPEAPSWFGQLRQRIEDAWRFVTGFDEHKRRRLREWITGLPQAIADAALERPWLPAGALLLLVGWLRLRRMRRAEPPTIAELRRACRALGIVPAPTETPRETLQRARRNRPEAPCDRLAAAVAAHEQARYRGR